MAYRLILGREPEPAELIDRVEAIRAGISFADMFTEIASSEEALRRASHVDRGWSDDHNAASADDSSAEHVVELAYRLLLGRAIEPNVLADRVAAIRAGVPFSQMFAEIAASEEAALRASEVERLVREHGSSAVRPSIEASTIALWRTIVTLAYRQILRRTPHDTEVIGWLENLTAGLSIGQFFSSIIESEEAQMLSRGSGLNMARLGFNLSDGEFLVRTSRPLLGRGMMPGEIVFWQNIIQEDPERRVEFAIRMINEYLKAHMGGDDDQMVHDPSSVSILGSDRKLTKREWDDRRKALSLGSDRTGRRSEVPCLMREGPFIHTGSYRVSMIASLYRGARYIAPFLENITSQTLFASAELIIIDADSPEHEIDVIQEYQKRFPNIVYKRINHRIGIYEAWNVATEIARGQYLTNTNLDDVRRYDSIELQATMLDQNDDVDIVYQDFYYSFEPNLTFDEIEAFGFRSNLPIITPQNLLMFNSPHNAPMWRARLHENLGGFDTRYRSAGDHEFWVRCLANGKTFRKINTPHVAYFQNPEGVSTRPDTRGIHEGRDIQARYCERLIPSVLLLSRRDFRSSLGFDGVDDTPSDTTPYYDLAQTALLRLGSRRFAARVDKKDPSDGTASVASDIVTPCAS